MTNEPLLVADGNLLTGIVTQKVQLVVAPTIMGVVGADKTTVKAFGDKDNYAALKVP